MLNLILNIVNDRGANTAMMGFTPRRAYSNAIASMNDKMQTEKYGFAGRPPWWPRANAQTVFKWIYFSTAYRVVTMIGAVIVGAGMFAGIYLLYYGPNSSGCNYSCTLNFCIRKDGFVYRVALSVTKHVIVGLRPLFSV